VSSKPTTGAVWLGLGEYTHPDDSEALDEARNRFLTAIREEAPEVLTTLASEPLTLFRTLWERWLATVPEDHRAIPHLYLLRSGAFRWYRFKNADPGHDPDGAELANVLIRWARRWNLDRSAADWLMERALLTLREWVLLPERVQRDDLRWAEYYEMTTVELTDEEQTVAFPRAYTWNPQFERKSAARERIRADFERHLADELDRIEAIANDRLTTPPKLTSGDVHFRWLVHYQVQDLDWDQIAERADRSAKQVREAARAIARTVGIEPRKGTPRGRPRTHSLNEARPKRGSGSRTVRRTRPTTRRPEK
jgi:hypothetical protein